MLDIRAAFFGAADLAARRQTQVIADRHSNKPPPLAIAPALTGSSRSAYRADMRWMVVVLVASLSGCSFAFVSGPPPHHEELPAFDCTESRVAPVLDTVFAALQAANFAVAAASTDEQWSDNFNGNPPISRGAAVPLYIAFAAVSTFSAYYGYSRTGACREAIEAARNRARGTTVGPQAPWQPPPAAAPGVPPAAPPPPVVLPPPAPPPEPSSPPIPPSAPPPVAPPPPPLPPPPSAAPSA